MYECIAYKSAAVELCNEWVLAWLQIFRHEDADFDRVRADMLVRRTVHVKAIEAGLWRGVVKWRHDWMTRELVLKV
jgi:hypothetical protein